jgi:hypothetical protein
LHAVGVSPTLGLREQIRKWPAMPSKRNSMLLIILFSTACRSVTTLDGERLGVRSEALRDYVEDVFRRQNRVSSQIAFALDDAQASPELLDELEAADRAILGACATLNEVAARRRDGRAAGWVRGSRAAHEAPDCERAVEHARSVLAGNEALDER